MILYLRVLKWLLLISKITSSLVLLPTPPSVLYHFFFFFSPVQANHFLNARLRFIFKGAFSRRHWHWMGCETTQKTQTQNLSNRMFPVCWPHSKEVSTWVTKSFHIRNTEQKTTNQVCGFFLGLHPVILSLAKTGYLTSASPSPFVWPNLTNNLRLAQIGS